MPERLESEVLHKVRYINTLTFTFTYAKTYKQYQKSKGNTDRQTDRQTNMLSRNYSSVLKRGYSHVLWLWRRQYYFTGIDDYRGSAVATGP